MKLFITRAEAGRYIASKVNNKAIRLFEIRKDYNLETGEFFGKYWYIYEITQNVFNNGQEEWWPGLWRNKSEAVKFLDQELQSIQG